VSKEVQKSGMEENYNTKKVVMTLQSLMERVTEDKVTPETVNAACNCASRIVDVLRVHIEAERLRGKVNPR
jgi:hemerythrin-like domain-containing protein